MAPESAFSPAFGPSSSEWLPSSDRLPLPRKQLSSAAADRTACQSRSVVEASCPLFPRPRRLWPQHRPRANRRSRGSITRSLLPAASGARGRGSAPAAETPGLGMQGGWLFKGTLPLPGRKQMAAGCKSTGESRHPPNQRSKGFSFLGLLTH